MSRWLSLIAICVCTSDFSIAQPLASRPTMGIQFQTPSEDAAKAYGLKGATGALIVAFEESSTAEQSGLEIGDLIVGIHGHRILNINQIPSAVGAANIGDNLPITVVRNGKEITFQVPLARLPMLMLPACPEFARSASLKSESDMSRVLGKDMKAMNLTELTQIESLVNQCKGKVAELSDFIIEDIRKRVERQRADVRARAKVALDQNKPALDARVERERKISQCQDKAC